ncbi:hypothetical protein ACLOJK_026808 [Asimina triloba]
MSGSHRHRRPSIQHREFASKGDPRAKNERVSLYSTTADGQAASPRSANWSRATLAQDAFNSSLSWATIEDGTIPSSSTAGACYLDDEDPEAPSVEESESAKQLSSPEGCTLFRVRRSPSSAIVKCTDLHQQKNSSLDGCQRRAVPRKYMRAHRWVLGKLKRDRGIGSGNGSSHRSGTPQTSPSNNSRAKKNLTSHLGKQLRGLSIPFTSRHAKSST